MRPMQTLNAANKRFGYGMVFFDSQGVKDAAEWYMRREMMSPLYTARWEEVPAVG